MTVRLRWKLPIIAKCRRQMTRPETGRVKVRKPSRLPWVALRVMSDDTRFLHPGFSRCSAGAVISDLVLANVASALISRQSAFGSLRAMRRPVPFLIRGKKGEESTDPSPSWTSVLTGLKCQNRTLMPPRASAPFCDPPKFTPP